MARTLGDLLAGRVHPAGPIVRASGTGRPTDAARAGHSVAVLLQIYAKCLAGQEDTARRRIEAALNF